MRVTSATIRARKRGVRELAAFWCSAIASDRATDAWTLKITDLDLATATPALRLAWAARGATLHDSSNAGSDTAAERWARAEAMLRTGWRPSP